MGILSNLMLKHYCNKYDKEKKLAKITHMEKEEQIPKELKMQDEQEYIEGLEQYKKYKQYNNKKIENIKRKYTDFFIEEPKLLMVYYDVLKDINEKKCDEYNIIRISDDNWKQAVEDNTQDEILIKVGYYNKIAKEFIDDANDGTALFWDFLLENYELKACFYTFKSSILIKYKGILDLVGLIKENQLYYNVNLEWKRSIRDYKKESIYEKFFYTLTRINKYEIKWYIEELFQAAFYISLITNIFEGLKENDDLLNIYYNLKNERCSDEYIVDKLYSIYDALYKKIFRVNLEKVYIEIWVNWMKHRRLTSTVKRSNQQQIIVNSVKDLIDVMINKLKCNASEYEIVRWIGNFLKINDNIDEELKFEIIQKIYDIVEQFKNRTKGKRQLVEKHKKEAETIMKNIEIEKERDRLLNGDLTKESTKRKIEKELALDISKIKNGYDFEKYVAELYKGLGYRIEEVTKKSGDQGADVIAYKYDEKFVIQAKFYSNPVGNKAVQEVVASIGMYKANNGIVITNNTFTAAAIELAKANNIELVDGKKIEEYKNQIIKSL